MIVLQEVGPYRLAVDDRETEELLPLVPGGPTFRYRTVIRIESRGACSFCGEHLCTCPGERGVAYWDPEATIAVLEPGRYGRGSRRFPVRTEVAFGSRGSASCSDPQVMLWVGELLAQVGRAVSERDEVPVSHAPDGRAVWLDPVLAAAS